MHGTRTADRHSYSSERAADLAIFRKVYGKELKIVCGRLASWQHRPEGMEVHELIGDNPNTLRLDLVKAKEIYSTRSSITPAQLVRPATGRQLREEIPSLLQPMENTWIRAMRHHENRDGGHFFELLFDKQSGDSLGIERNQIWQRLELSAGAPVGSSSWRQYTPDISLAYIPPGTVPTETVKTLARVIEGTVCGLPVQLGPVNLPIDHSE